MKRMITLVALAATLTLTACATFPAGDYPAAQKSLLKCSTCGLEFTDPQGLEQHRERDGHR